MRQMPASCVRPIATPRSAVQVAGVVRLAPARDLADVIEQHWIVAWDRRDLPPVQQEVLPDPCVNLTVEPVGVRLHGVVTGRAQHELAGAGLVLGTKFRPGRFSGYLPEPVSAIANRVLTPRDAWGPAGAELEHSLAACKSVIDMIAVVSAFVRSRRPARDSTRELVARILDTMAAAPVGTRVDEIAERAAISTRTLQRLFATHVGASPKAVLQQRRLQEATDRLSVDNSNLARLAADLGYSDQAHFTRHFRTVLGRTPTGVHALDARPSAPAALTTRAG
jgi:AraC-like DNA-binding protein